MAVTHNLGYPRIGARRQLKKGLERYWRGESSAGELAEVASLIQQQNWRDQESLDWTPVGDFSLYDHVLDLSFTLGLLPERVSGRDLDDYFRLARGRVHGDGPGISAGEMTKWFDTNYHFIVPEIEDGSRLEVSADRMVRPFRYAQSIGVSAKPVLLGPVTFLWLAKEKGGVKRLELLPAVINAYRTILEELGEAGAEWVQLDEPILALELPEEWKEALRKAYQELSFGGPKVLLATYFGSLRSNLLLAAGLPTHGLHVDGVRGEAEIKTAHALVNPARILSLGVVDGRNIWKTDLTRVLDVIEPIHEEREDRLWIAPSCSLLHVPVDLELEQELDAELKNWLAFARQKIDEVSVLGRALNQGRGAVYDQLAENQSALQSRRCSTRVVSEPVRQGLREVTPAMHRRSSPFEQRQPEQKKRLALPAYPTTTIGSFPQTAEIRKARQSHRAGELTEEDYVLKMQGEIRFCIERQESLGLDVLVHGEPERNDMVEYFGELLSGFAITQLGWVQSYGSRCVKPPILYGDVSRPKPMTVDWINYAQSLTSRPVKGMLTGPVTILNWSFARDDQPRSVSCQQIALAIRQEVQDLEASGVRAIQIDEAALREGLPLREDEWGAYLEWAVGAFRLASSGVRDETQIHTHMCYSEFNDIIASIADLDADVITIETSRSDMELLDAFDSFNYPNEIGPGVYDIHSPNIPSEEQVARLMKSAARRVPPERLWVNPDCGLKTRRWEEVMPALKNMVGAARHLRREHARRHVPGTVKEQKTASLS